MPHAIDKAVVNASPVIVLARIHRVDLLRLLYHQILIPTAVADEIRAGNPDDPARIWLESDGKDLIGVAGSVDSLIAAWDLGAGESAVLHWARRNPEFEAIIDDRAARSCATALKIPVRGTLGLVLLAKQEGHISLARPVLDELVQAGLRLSPGIIDTALKLVGEQ